MNYDHILSELTKVALNLQDKFIAFIPKLIFALVILLVGFLLARLVEFLVKRFITYLNRVLNDRFKNQIRHIDFGRSALFISKAFFWIILVFFFILTAEVLELSIITIWLGSILEYSPNIMAAILIIFIGIIAGRVVAEMITAATSRIGITYGGVLGKIVQYTILITSIVIAIDQVGVDIAFLTNLVIIIITALLFGAALAFGLGAKTSVSNILAAYYVHKLYKEGDYVKIGDIEGRITRIEPTAVVLDAKGGQVSVPAKDFNELKSVLVKKDRQA